MFSLKNLSEEKLNLLRKAIINNIDISDINIENYDICQIEQLMLGKSENIDISLYNQPKFNADQMREIRYGLVSKINVEVYADKKYNVNMMVLLRKALLSNINLDFIKNKVFNESQLKIFIEMKKYEISDDIIEKIYELNYSENILKLLCKIIKMGYNCNEILDNKYKEQYIQAFLKCFERNIDISILKINLNLTTRDLNALIMALEYKIENNICKNFIENKIGLNEFYENIYKKINEINCSDYLMKKVMEEDYILLNEKQKIELKEIIEYFKKFNLSDNDFKMLKNYNWEQLEEIKFAFEDNVCILKEINPLLTDMEIYQIRILKLFKKEMFSFYKKLNPYFILKINTTIENMKEYSDNKIDESQYNTIINFYKEKDNWVVKRCYDNKVLFKNRDIYKLMEDYKKYLKLTKEMNYDEVCLLE